MAHRSDTIKRARGWQTGTQSHAVLVPSAKVSAFLTLYEALLAANDGRERELQERIGVSWRQVERMRVDCYLRTDVAHKILAAYKASKA